MVSKTGMYDRLPSRLESSLITCKSEKNVFCLVLWVNKLSLTASSQLFNNFIKTPPSDPTFYNHSIFWFSYLLNTFHRQCQHFPMFFKIKHLVCSTSCTKWAIMQEYFTNSVRALGKQWNILYVGIWLLTTFLMLE